MPHIEDLAQFKTNLERIGNEIQVLAEHGLSPETISPPTPDEIEFMIEANSLNVRANPVSQTDDQESQSSPFDDLLATTGVSASPSSDNETNEFKDSLADLFGTDTDDNTDTGIEGDSGETFDIDSDFDLDIPPVDTGDTDEIHPEEEALLDDFLSTFGTQQEDDFDIFSEPEKPMEPDEFSDPTEQELPAELDESAEFVSPEETDTPDETETFEDLEDFDFTDPIQEGIPEDIFEEPTGIDDFDIFETPAEEISTDEPPEELELPAELDETTEYGSPGETDIPDETETFEDLEDFSFDDPFSDENPTDALSMDDESEPDAGSEVGGEFDEGEFGETEFALDDFSLESTDEELEELDDTSMEAGIDIGEFGDISDDTPDFGSDEFSDADFGDTSDMNEPPPLDLDGDLEAEFGDEFSDEFSMGDFGAEFGILEDSIDTSLVNDDEVAEQLDTEEFAAATLADQTGEFSLSDKQYEHLKESIEAQPLNVKLVVAEIISQGKAPFEDIQRLIQALVDGEPPKKIAAIASKISGKRLTVPKNYEKRSGQAFADEQQSFLYQFRDRIWPVMRVAILIAAVSSALIWLSYSYIYTPLYARSLYNQGLTAIAAQQYPRANTLFDRAYGIWPDNTKFFDYAHAYINQRQYRLAQEKYQQLLRMDRNNRMGILEYADFSAYTMRDYQTGLDTLDRLLNIDKNDYDPLLAQGDIFMEWARYTTDPLLQEERYDAARSAFVRLTNVHGQTDPLLFRLLLYYVRTGNLAKSFQLQQVFTADPRAKIEPRIYGELAGFYVDTWISGQTSPVIPSTNPDIITPTGFGPDLLEEAQKLLFAALELEPRIPEVHYNLARSFAEQTRYDQELRALNSARILFNEVREQRTLTQFEVAQEIDTTISLGESAERTGNIVSAEREYRRAVSLHQQAKQNLQVQPSHTFGRLYANLGNLYYYEGNDYPSALQFYAQALENGFGQGNRPNLPSQVRDIHYKMSFIHYGTGTPEGYQKALNHILIAEGPSPTANSNLMYTKANTLYQLGNYHAAAAQYQRLINRLVQQRESIATFLLQEDRAHRGLIDFMIRSYNNLGVTMFQLSRTAGIDRVRRQVEAQYYLSKATELAENVARDVETAIRADTRNLAFLNLRSILVPGFSGEVLIDPDVPKDLQTVTF